MIKNINKIFFLILMTNISLVSALPSKKAKITNNVEYQNNDHTKLEFREFIKKTFASNCSPFFYEKK